MYTWPSLGVAPPPLEIYHPNFVWYVETSSSRDINPMSYHLTAFELTNQLLYMNFPSLERNIFFRKI